jgi:chromosome segregation ATPase
MNTRIQAAKENLRKKQKYEEQLQRVTAILQEEEKKVEQLKRQLSKEEEDVARLEGFSLASIFYTVIGQKLEKIDKEQQEVIAAKLKYEEAVQTIEDIKKEIQQYKEKLKDVANAKAQYDELVSRKEQMIYDQNSFWSEELFALTEREAEAFSQIKEYDEAISAGEAAVDKLNEALASLDSAKGWSTFDMLGGGLLSTAMKHGKMDDAKEYIHQVQKHLRHFQAELSDIEGQMKTNLEMGGLLRFSDYFFDGLIIDWFVHGQISDCYDQTVETKQKVSEVLRMLNEKRDSLDAELSAIKEKRADIIEFAN